MSVVIRLPFFQEGSYPFLELGALAHFVAKRLLRRFAGADQFSLGFTQLLLYSLNRRRAISGDQICQTQGLLHQIAF